MYIYDSGKTSVIKFKNNDVKKQNKKSLSFWMWSLVNWLLLQNILNIRKNNRDSQGMSNNNSPFYYPIEGDGA